MQTVIAMKITDTLHALRVGFELALSPTVRLERFTWVHVLTGPGPCLIDAGVAGAWPAIQRHLDGLGLAAGAIGRCLLTHAHPDHIGAAVSLRAAHGCGFSIHQADRPWLEDVDLQRRQRPVPDFDRLVEGSVCADQTLADGEVLDAGHPVSLRVLHTPGHSDGHVAFHLADQGVLIAGDTLPPPGQMPLYHDLPALAGSLHRLRGLNAGWLLSSMDPEPVSGERDVRQRIDASLGWLRQVHTAVRDSVEGRSQMDLAARTGDVMARLGLPPFAANGLTAQAVAAHLRDLDRGV